jgi:flagellar biosynthesis/type III secretory pathway protein FliH
MKPKKKDWTRKEIDEERGYQKGFQYGLEIGKKEGIQSERKRVRRTINEKICFLRTEARIYKKDKGFLAMVLFTIVILEEILAKINSEKIAE